MSERELLRLLHRAAIALRGNANSAAAYGNGDKAEHEHSLARKLQGPATVTIKNLYRRARMGVGA